MSLFVATAVLPVYGCRSHPKDFDARPHASNHFILRESTDRVPVHEIAREMEAGWHDGGFLEGVWRERKWYPYLLGPLWILALLFGSSRRRVGWALLAVSVAIALFEAVYLASDYMGFSKGGWHGLETAFVWLIVVAVLFWRPRGVGLLDPAATVSAQALLAICHALTFPLYDGGAWLSEGFSTSAVVTTIATNYRPGFWLALVGLGLAAAPLYAPALLRRRAPEPPLPAPSPAADLSRAFE